MSGPPPPIRRKAPPPARRTAPPPPTVAAPPTPSRSTIRGWGWVAPDEPVHMATYVNGREITTKCGMVAEGIEWTGYSNRVTCHECVILCPKVIHDATVCQCSRLVATPELMARMLAGRKI